MSEEPLDAAARRAWRRIVGVQLLVGAVIVGLIVMVLVVGLGGIGDYASRGLSK